MNFSELIKAATVCIIALLTISLWKIMSNGSVLLYIHPRTLPLLEAALLILFILTLFNIKTFPKTSIRKVLHWKVFILLLPLAAGALIHPDSPSSRMARQKGLLPLTMVAYNQKDKVPFNTAVHSNAAVNSDTVNTSAVRNRVGNGDTIAVAAENEMVLLIPSGSSRMADTLSDDSLYIYIDRIYGNPIQSDKKRIVMTGFITIDTLLGKNSFFLARMMITCCAADAMSIGFYCLTDSLPDVHDGDWVQIMGCIGTLSFKLPWDSEKRLLPVLNVEQIKKTTTPKRQYIYPVAY